MPSRLLIIEDDPSLNDMLCLHFEDEGLQTEGALSCAQGLERLAASRFDLILLDQQLPDGTGLDLLRTLAADYPELAVVMITGQHDLELAIEAMKVGATDFIHKPLNVEELRRVVGQALQNQRLSQQAESAADAGPARLAARELIGRSAAMLAVSKEIGLSAQSNANVLITGESGTGKEVVARLIHLHSRREGPFVAINCAAIVDTLLESELFGHEKGAFTGATFRKPGKFEQAQQGTLFLDEIGELAAPLQGKLLRALQERVFERVGGTEPIHTDCRVIAATNRDLVAETAAHRFREDLLYRLKVISIHIPPLRERKEDIPLLAQSLAARIAERLEKPVPKISEDALVRLTDYDWPGNVRELENVLTQAMVHARGSLLTPDLIRTEPPRRIESDAAAEVSGEPSEDLRSLEQVEAEHIQRVLLHARGHKGRACEILGISRPALDRKIRKFSLVVPSKAD